MTFYVEDETGTDFGFSAEEVVKAVALEVLDEEGCPFEVQLNVLITDNSGIREYNGKFRGIEKETDVLSFPNLNFMEPADFSCADETDCEADYFDPDNGELILGDIILSAQKVWEQAESYGHSPKREFAFLIAHSMLHLCGYDHLEKEEASVMEHKQEEILNRLSITRGEADDESDGA